MRKIKTKDFYGARFAKRKFEYFLMMYEKRKRKDIKRDKGRSERNNLRNEFVIVNLSATLSHISLESSLSHRIYKFILFYLSRNVIHRVVTDVFS